MKSQIKIVSKEEAHRLIDSIPGEEVMILTYSSDVGLSDTGKYVKKRRSKKIVDKASVLVLMKNNPVTTLNLHHRFFEDLSNYKRENIVRSILLPKLE